MITSPLPAEFSPVVPTGNDHVALPDISPRGAVASLQLLSMQLSGLIGIEGTPLLRPILPQHAATSPRVELLDYWIPRFTWESDALIITETVFAPVGHRGLVMVIDMGNAGREPATVSLGLEGTWDRTAFTLFSGRTLAVLKSIRPDPWTKSLVMEASGPLPVVGWAIHPHPEVPLPEAEQTAGTLRYSLARTVTLNPGERATAAYYIGVAREADGARTAAVDLRRRGWGTLLQETRTWLQARAVNGSQTPALNDSGVLAEIFHRNLLFNRFFACGRTIDTDQLVWVTSRSPRYYVSAAFWSRDAFLWSLPGLLLADPKTAREAVTYACQTQWHNAGMHAQYLDGTVIYPGFELDEFAAFAIGLGHYLRATGDPAVMKEEGVTEVILSYADRLAAYGSAGGLYSTFLDPSDDPVRYPYLTYDNVLAWRGLLDVAEFLRQLDRPSEETRAREMAAALQEAIWRQCVVEGPGGPMFAWAVDGEGRHELYDNPGGSLLLLPHYGFCPADHPTYLNTAAWIRSPQNPWFISGRFAAAASVHSPDPWPMAVVNDLLLGRSEGLAWLAGAEMDGRLACETVDRETGRVRSGGGFATFAGLLAAALHRHRDRWT